MVVESNQRQTSVTVVLTRRNRLSRFAAAGKDPKYRDPGSSNKLELIKQERLCRNKSKHESRTK